MSFILDALRKSEQERQRHQSPGMPDFRARSRAAGQPYWLPLVIVLVGINIGLLLFLWLNSAPQTNTPVAATTATGPVAVAENTAPLTAPAPAPASAISPVTPLAADTTSSDATTTLPLDAAPAEKERIAVAATERNLSSELAPRPLPAPELLATGSPATGAPQSAYGNLPTLVELTMAGTISLDPLNMDMHVFSPQVAERFVFINMNKYREGDSLREGPVLKTITEDGVILDYQGRTFLVTRE